MIRAPTLYIWKLLMEKNETIFQFNLFKLKNYIIFENHEDVFIFYEKSYKCIYCIFQYSALNKKVLRYINDLKFRYKNALLRHTLIKTKYSFSVVYACSALFLI